MKKMLETILCLQCANLVLELAKKCERLARKLSFLKTLAASYKKSGLRIGFSDAPLEPSNRQGYAWRIIRASIKNNRNEHIQDCKLYIEVNGKTHLLNEGSFSLLAHKTKYVKLARYEESLSPDTKGEKNIILYLKSGFFANESANLSAEHAHFIKVRLENIDEKKTLETRCKILIENGKLKLEKI